MFCLHLQLSKSMIKLNMSWIELSNFLIFLTEHFRKHLLWVSFDFMCEFEQYFFKFWFDFMCKYLICPQIFFLIWTEGNRMSYDLNGKTITYKRILALQCKGFVSFMPAQN